MANEKKACLHLKDGNWIQVSVSPENWPPTIDHRVEGRLVRFEYVGVQYGVGAYAELPEEIVS